MESEINIGNLKGMERLHLIIQHDKKQSMDEELDSRTDSIAIIETAMNLTMLQASKAIKITLEVED